MLAQRAEAGRPIRAGLIGAGKFGSMFLAQARHTPGLHVLGIADLDAGRAERALAETGWPREQGAAPSFAAALETGATHITDDSGSLIAAHGLDVVIDATGDGDIFAMAGAPFESDITEEDIHHKINVAFTWGGVDMERYFEFRREHPEEYRAIRTEGRESGLSPDAGPHVMPRNDVALFMGPKLTGYSAIDVEDLTEVEIESRRRMMQLLEFYKGQTPGFEDAWVMTTAPQMGTRHSRRLVGTKKIVREEWTAGKLHEDEIAISPPPNPRNPNVSIPLGSLIPVGVDNMLAAGRNLSCDSTMHTFLRLIPQCWEMGQAAGVAAAVAANSGVRVRDVDVTEVRSQLAKQGVVLHQDVSVRLTQSERNVSDYSREIAQGH